MRVELGVQISVCKLWTGVVCLGMAWVSVKRMLGVYNDCLVCRLAHACAEHFLIPVLLTAFGKTVRLPARSCVSEVGISVGS